jgi:hypothetical protein
MLAQANGTTLTSDTSDETNIIFNDNVVTNEKPLLHADIANPTRKNVKTREPFVANRYRHPARSLLHCQTKPLIKWQIRHLL